MSCQHGNWSDCDLCEAIDAAWKSGYESGKAQSETPCSYNEAVAVLETLAAKGFALTGDEAEKFRAVADRIAPNGVI